jgi:subtilisin family serine protease
MDDTSAGINGINARNLMSAVGVLLNGANQGIGQVEQLRPGRPPRPPDLVGDDPAHSHPDVYPSAVYRRDGAVNLNQYVTTPSDSQGHATQVAGVMIATGQANRGVASFAYLHAGAIASDQADIAEEVFRQSVITMQHVATRRPIPAIDPDGDIRAINASFYYRTEQPMFDAESTMTKGLDWSARQHNVLYVKSRGNFSITTGLPITGYPVDNYNGINVASTQMTQGIFNRVPTPNDPTISNDFTNASDGRRLTSIVAPGIGIFTTRVDQDDYSAANGSSVAAPHVTGAVALLQQYADERIAAGAAGWNELARRHEVMKAVLMNSTDKIKGLLGMQKTIVKADGVSTWLQSDARDTDDNDNPGGRALPLDNELGTGQLNVACPPSQNSDRARDRRRIRT